MKENGGFLFDFTMMQYRHADRAMGIQRFSRDILKTLRSRKCICGVIEMTEVFSAFDVVMSMPDVEKHVGKWVAVVNHRVVAIEDTLEEAYRKAMKEHPECEPYLTRIPEEHILIL